MLALREKEKLEEELKEFVDILQGIDSKHTKYKGTAFIGKLQGRFMQECCNTNNLYERLKRHIEEDNIYVTPNRFRGFKRTQEELWQLRFLYMDLDILKDTKLSIQEAYSILMDMCRDNIIPYPTMVVNTGRGLQAYWSIGDYVANKTNIAFWKDVQKCLFSKLEHLGADKKVTTDTARVLRIPTCYNSKNGNRASLWYSNKATTYKLADLKEEYFLEELTYKPKPVKSKSHTIQSKKTRNTKTIKYLKEVKTPYTLHKARVEDILTLLKLREFDLTEGLRNETLFILAYHYATVKNPTSEELSHFIRGINLELVNGLEEYEVNSIVNSAYKYYLQFITEKEKSLVSRNTSLNSILSVLDKQSFLYHYLVYSNNSLIELFNISSGEMLELKTLIDGEEKNKRKLVRERSKRRNGEGLTNREQKKKDTQESIQKLKLQGLTQKQVADQIAIGIATVKRNWNL